MMLFLKAQQKRRVKEKLISLEHLSYYCLTSDKDFSKDKIRSSLEEGAFFCNAIAGSKGQYK